MSFEAEPAALLFEFDPVGINVGHDTDEYTPEADVFSEEFERWFGDAGGKDHYREIARRTWDLWQSHTGDAR